MGKLIHIGFGNVVNTGKIIAIVSPDSAPVKRMVQKAKETGMAIDATQGRKTKAVLVMENSQIVLSALLPETISGRAQTEDGQTEEELRDIYCCLRSVGGRQGPFDEAAGGGV